MSVKPWTHIEDVVRENWKLKEQAVGDITEIRRLKKQIVELQTASETAYLNATKGN